MIKAQDIYKSYGDLAVLNGVSLSINEAEIVTILGKSGAGKSTTLCDYWLYHRFFSISV